MIPRIAIRWRRFWRVTALDRLAVAEIWIYGLHCFGLSPGFGLFTLRRNGPAPFDGVPAFSLCVGGFFDLLALPAPANSGFFANQDAPADTKGVGHLLSEFVK
jgi:hypothetical protein